MKRGSDSIKPAIKPKTKKIQNQKIYLTLPIGKSVNLCYRTSKSGRKFLTKAAQKWFDDVRVIIANEVKKQKWTVTERTKIIAECMVYWKDWRTRDTHNLDKNLCDSLEGLLFDNDCYLLMRWTDWKVDKDNPRLEILVRVFDDEKDVWKYDKKFK